MPGKDLRRRSGSWDYCGDSFSEYREVRNTPRLAALVALPLRLLPLERSLKSKNFAGDDARSDDATSQCELITSSVGTSRTHTSQRDIIPATTARMTQVKNHGHQPAPYGVAPARNGCTAATYILAFIRSQERLISGRREKMNQNDATFQSYRV